MENGEHTDRPRSAASRPPQAEGFTGASRETPLYTEIPLSSLRRTPNSGRPSDEAVRRDSYGRPIAASSGSSYASPYGGRAAGSARPAPSYTDRSSAAPRPQPSATFTEISWDSLREGRFDAPAAPSAEPYAPAQAERPDYTQYSQPPQRAASFSTGASRTAPARRAGYTRPAAPSRTVRPGTPGAPPPSGNRRSGSAPRRRRRGPHPLFYVIGFVLAALLILGISRMAGSSRSRTPTPTPVQYVPGSAVTAAPNTATPGPTQDPEAEPTPEVTPTPSPEPSPTPSGPKAARSGNLIVPADWGAAVPERAKAVFDSHFDRSCMIGNSLVEGFLMWSGMTNIRYIYNTGAVVSSVIGFLDLAPITLNPDYYTDIYLMFGLNEIGTSVNSFVQNYQKVVEYIREYQPNANIYIISVTPVTQKVDEDPDEVQTMERIRNFNAALKEFCLDNDCWYLDIYSMLLDGQGYLSAEYAYEGDGKHFEKSGYVAWANYMKTHYVDAGLLTE